MYAIHSPAIMTRIIPHSFRSSDPRGDGCGQGETNLVNRRESSLIHPRPSMLYTSERWEILGGNQIEHELNTCIEFPAKHRLSTGEVGGMPVHGRTRLMHPSHAELE